MPLSTADVQRTSPMPLHACSPGCPAYNPCRGRQGARRERGQQLTWNQGAHPAPTPPHFQRIPHSALGLLRGPPLLPHGCYGCPGGWWVVLGAGSCHAEEPRSHAAARAMLPSNWVEDPFTVCPLHGLTVAAIEVLVGAQFCPDRVLDCPTLLGLLIARHLSSRWQWVLIYGLPGTNPLVCLELCPRRCQVVVPHWLSPPPVCA